MGFELGPEFQRKPPDGWLPARAYPIEKSIWHGRTEAGGGNEAVLESSMRLDVTWRVEIEGREPFEFAESRRAPVWTLGMAQGGGKRWYSVRLKPTGGLLTKVGVPCFVDPANGANLWIDWDTAYAEHEPVWEQDAAVAREVERRRGGIEGVLGRIGNPLTRKIDASEEHLVQEAIAAEVERTAQVVAEGQARATAMGFAPVGADEVAELERRTAELERVFASGTEVTATVLGNVDAGRTLANIPVFVITWDFEFDGRAQFAELEHVWGPRVAKRYKVGKQFPLRVDPADPTKVAPGR